MSRILVPILVMALGASARADKVDWSQYIDKNPSAPLKTAPAPAPTPAAKTAPARRPEKVAAKPKAKTPAKPKARTR